MDFDQMLETWRTQDAAPPYEVNHDVLRQALEAEDARVRRLHRFHRRTLWFCWIFGTGMAVFAGFWIAITITNGWPAIYVITSAASVGLFALGDITKHQNHAHDLAARITNGCRAIVDRHFGTIPGDQNRVVGQPDHRALAQHFGDWIFDLPAGFLVYDREHLIEWLPLRVGLIPPGERLRYRVGKSHIAVGVGYVLKQPRFAVFFGKTAILPTHQRMQFRVFVDEARDAPQEPMFFEIL